MHKTLQQGKLACDQCAKLMFFKTKMQTKKAVFCQAKFNIYLKSSCGVEKGWLTVNTTNNHSAIFIDDADLGAVCCPSHVADYTLVPVRSAIKCSCC